MYIVKESHTNFISNGNAINKMKIYQSVTVKERCIMIRYEKFNSFSMEVICCCIQTSNFKFKLLIVDIFLR
jgi:hypothetical protein